MSIGDMGYSGSTFFTTTNNTYLVKSIPRHFEYSFFKNDLLLPYAEYMHDNPSSLLVRITDFLACNQWSLGTALALAPTHHIIMENIKTGEGEGWETYDLKPMSYFYPERDVAGGVLTSEATKSRLADDFNEKISLAVDDAADFTLQLQKDTAFLAAHNAVDYSLFLIIGVGWRFVHRDRINFVCFGFTLAVTKTLLREFKRVHESTARISLPPWFTPSCHLLLLLFLWWWRCGCCWLYDCCRSHCCGWCCWCCSYSHRCGRWWLRW